MCKALRLKSVLTYQCFLVELLLFKKIITLESVGKGHK